MKRPNLKSKFSKICYQKIIPASTFIINGIVIINFIYLYYEYYFTNKLFLFIYPDWVLIINIFLGVIAVILSFYTYRGKLSVKLLLIANLSIWGMILIDCNKGFIF